MGSYLELTETSICLFACFDDQGAFTIQGMVFNMTYSYFI